MAANLPDSPSPPRPASQRRLTVAAVLIVLLLSALDQTIVSTAMPRIIVELRGLERIAWVGTAYLLASTVVVPIYGKFGDLYGRRPILIFGVLVFLAGSALCGLAGEFGPLPLIGDGMNQLIVCRALQGLGAGALTTGAFAAIADIVSPAERGKYTGLFGAMFGFASVAGPVIGGFLTDHATISLAGHVIGGWRFVFYVNLPLGAVALWVLIARLPNTGGQIGGERRIDWLGSGLILVAFVPLLLALSWGGHAHPWRSPEIVGLLLLSAVGLVLLIAASAGKEHAVVPLDLFAEPVFTRGNTALFLINTAFMGIVMFLPLYLQVARGVAATASGFALLPLMGGVLVGSVVAGRIVTRTRQYKPVLVVGGMLILAAVGLLIEVGPMTTSDGLSLRLALLGLGLGPAQGMFTLAIQSAVDKSRVGVATASAQFFRQIGATIGVAMFGAILTNQLAAELPRRAPDLIHAVPGTEAGQSQGAGSGEGHRDETGKAIAVGRDEPSGFDISRAQVLAMDPAALKAQLASGGITDPARIAATDAGLRGSFSDAILGLFPISGLLLVLAFVVTLMVPGRRLRGDEDAGHRLATEAGAPAE